MDIVIIFLCIITGVGISYFIKKKNDNNIDRINQYCKRYLLNQDKPLFKYIEKLASEFDSNDVMASATSYDMFKYNCIDSIIHKLNNRISKCGIDWIEIPFNKKDKSHIDKYADVLIKEATGEIVNGSKIDVILATIFTNTVAENIDEAQKIEKEAIEYHKKFGEEPNGDPILHPHESKSDISEEDDMREKSFSELLGIGTAEDLEDD